MKILFTLLSIEQKNQNYLISAKNLAGNILDETNHDVLISTNNLDFFSDILSDRVFVRNNISENSILNYGDEFNYNLKYHAFLELPESYDVVIYLDCDVKLNGWKKESDDYIFEMIQNYNFGADRLNCVLSHEIGYFLQNTGGVFRHKIQSYEVIDRYSESDDIMNSQLPSEHFLIFKNTPEKITIFAEEWKLLNEFLQNKNGSGGSWGDGFEIGISARKAGFTETFNISSGIWSEVLGIRFNGNKL